MRWVATATVLMLALAMPARASLIGDAHHVINTTYRSQTDGFQRGRITACHRTRQAVDCDVLLTDPIPAGSSCQGGALASAVSVGVCEAPQIPTRESAVVRLRVRVGRIYRLAVGSRAIAKGAP